MRSKTKKRMKIK